MEDFKSMRSRIINCLQNMKGSNGFNKEQLDEIIMISDSCRDHLPSRFMSVLESFDANYSYSENLQDELAKRLLMILEVERSLPERQVLLASDASTPTFELESDDKKRVGKLCSDMRKIVFASTFFDEPHKKRLLDRVAAIEKEVHETRGKLDVVLAGVVDIGEALGKFGEKVEPLTKRMQEIAQITRRGSKEYEQIPAPEEIKKLPPPEEEK